MTKKRILVVGGAGFIGSHVNNFLLENDFETVIFDDLSYGNQNSIIGGDFIKGNLAHVDEINSVFERYSFDAVMHFAAYIDVGASVKDPAIYFRNNVVNSLNLFDAMLSHHVNHLIFSSTAAIFGIPDFIPVDEEHPCRPINPYGESKWMIEKILQRYAHAYGFKSCCLRYFNAAGGDPAGRIKNYKKKENNLIPIFLRSLLQPGGRLTIFGTDYSTPDGTCIRDYIHVCDLASAHVLAMQKLWKSDKGSHLCYNLGNGLGFSVREVICTAEAVTGKKGTIIEGPRREGDPAILVSSSQKAQKELGWRPSYPNLEDIIEHAWLGLA